MKWSIVLLAAGLMYGWVCVADVILEGGGVRLQLDAEGRAVALRRTGDDRNCVREESALPIASVRMNGRDQHVTHVEKVDGGLRLAFGDSGTVLEYEVVGEAGWLLFRLGAVRGARPDSVTLLQVAPSVVETVGRRLNGAYDDRTAVCIMAASRHPDCGPRGGGTNTILRATVPDSPGPPMEGAAVALIVCARDEFKAIAKRISHAYGLLTNETDEGTPVKDSDLVRGSYYFISFGESDVGTAIDYCRRAGIRQVMLSSGAWCSSVGHYQFNRRQYPDGIESLKRVVDALHSAGILVGMHTFVSKVSKRDPYISPVPTHRFWRRFETTLAQDLTAEQTEIRTTGDLRQWAGSSASAEKYWEGGVAKHREVVIDDEIIQYGSVGPEGTWNTFFGCKRGAWKTAPKPHAAGTAAVHYGVDGCINGYIIDQETDLMAEVADRIAGIFNTCGFDMVYFDGGEDVDRRRFRYYASNFQEQAMRRFAKRPIVHMGTIMTHRLWHSFARSSTVDTYLNTIRGQIIGGKPPAEWPTVKQHINRSVRYMLEVRKSMMPGELGWFGIWPRQENTDGLQLDEIEYLMAKSLGYDVPVSLQTSFASMGAHPLTPEILNIVRMYETLRLGEGCPEQVRERLREQDRDVIMVNRAEGRSFVDVKPVESVGGTREVRAFAGELDEGSVATIWHYCRAARVTLPIAPDEIEMTDLLGNTLPWEETGEKQVVFTADCHRRTLLCPGMSPERLGAVLGAATVEAIPAAVVVVQAEDARKLVGRMALGSAVGIAEPDAVGDVLVCTGTANYTAANPWYASYTVDIPHDGIWWVWGRVRYPSGGDDSFGIVPDGEEATLQGNQVLGNCGVNEKRWHWTGRGGGSTTVPPGAPIRIKLPKGPFSFRIYGRESRSDLTLTPRLDMILFTDDPMYTPPEKGERL